MLEVIGISNTALVTMISAALAMLSFIGVVLPLLAKSEKQERFKSVIEKRRKDLFEKTRSELENRHKKGTQSLSAKDSVAMVFKVQEMLGDMGDKVRDQLLQAGIRNPSAPVKFIAARAILPFFFMGIGLMFISGMKEPSNIAILAILGGGVVAGYFLPKVLLKNMIDKRSLEINYAFPDALDMMLICVQGGIGLEQTVQRIAEEISEHSPTLAEELGILSAEMAMLNDRRAALQDFARRVGSGSAKTFATALVQAEQYGTSVSQAMRVIANDLRDQRMAEAERKAAALPPKLTVPMILFFLPVLFVVIMAPAVIQAQAILK